MSVSNRDPWAAPDPFRPDENGARQTNDPNASWNYESWQSPSPNPSHGAGDSAPWSNSSHPYQSAGYGGRQTPPANAAYHPGAGAPPTGKSRVAAGVLGILLGALGVHNFYLGRTALGVAQLLITLLSFGALSFIPAIWGVAEGVLYLTSNAPRWSTDADGRPLYR